MNTAKITNLILTLFLTNPVLMAQDLYQHTTPIEPYVIQYGHDQQAINYFYGPMPKGWGTQQAAESPEQIQRLITLDNEYLRKLKDFPYAKLNTNGQVDYILLNRKVKFDMEVLQKQLKTYERLKSYVPFDHIIYDFEKLRRRGTSINGEEIAGNLQQAIKLVKEASEKLKNVNPIPYVDVDFLKEVIRSLTLRLSSAFDFYNEYDPMFTWWVPSPYKQLSEELNNYSKLIVEKSDWKVFNDGSNIGGAPIGKEAFNKQLKDEMIAYTTDDLLRL